jgi:hypothetical protein
MKDLLASNTMMMSEITMERLFNLPKASYTNHFYLENVVSAFRRVFQNDHSDVTLLYPHDPMYEALAEQEQDLRGFDLDASQSAGDEA